MRFDHSVDYFSKYPADKFTVEYDFTNDITTGDSLVSCTATIYESDGTDKTASMISSTSVSDPDVTFIIDAGSAGKTYSIKIVGVTTNGDKYTHYVTCEVYGSLTLNTKLADSNANSYATLEEANAYIRNRYGHDNTWDVLSDEGKKRALMEATNDLERFNYIDDKYYDSQALQFPRDTHDIITGNCAATLAINSFRNSGLYSTTYMKYPTNYWKYGTVHITSGTPVYDVRNIDTSNVTNGKITTTENFTATPSTSTQFIIFAPLDVDIKNAQCEQALFIVQNTGADVLQNYKDMGIERIDIGDASMEFKSGSSTKVPISSEAKALLSRWIKRKLRVGRC